MYSLDTPNTNKSYNEVENMGLFYNYIGPCCLNPEKRKKKTARKEGKKKLMTPT